MALMGKLNINDLDRVIKDLLKSQQTFEDTLADLAEHIPPEAIQAMCTTCRDERILEYHCSQTFQGMRAYDLYTCTICHGTFAYNISPSWQKLLDMHLKNK